MTDYRQTKEQVAWLKGWRAGKQASELSHDGGNTFLVDIERNLIWGPFASDQEASAAKEKMTGEDGYLWALSNLRVFDPVGVVDGRIFEADDE